ncbi:hypothetical protein B0J11DRAFT_286378 [Dendryphion nanum]|uniref:Uncharacterized protein n=1 Tax=Dendryphion nanum TaxID=256645 RepID=A0A9P9IPQ7_9PLEO|nr:hypothetical protein B0J11DRAFT_286378 [Dendryphion nanum]
MTASSLVLYRPAAPSSLTTTTRASSLISSRLFNAQTGTAIATELLYRILIDIVNRLLHSFHKFAVARIDQFSDYMDRRANERQQQRQDAARMRKESRENGLGIVEEVGKLVEERGFDCPMGQSQNPPQPPKWVQGVLEGVREGRMEEKDFWIHTHTG